MDKATTQVMGTWVATCPSPPPEALWTASWLSHPCSVTQSPCMGRPALIIQQIFPGHDFHCNTNRPKKPDAVHVYSIMSLIGLTGLLPSDHAVDCRWYTVGRHALKNKLSVFSSQQQLTCDIISGNVNSIATSDITLARGRQVGKWRRVKHKGLRSMHYSWALQVSRAKGRWDNAL